MSTVNRPTVREIDKTLARVLRRVRVLEHEVPHRLRPPTRPLGPNSFQRLSVGHLAVAALVGLAVGRWNQGLNLAQERFFEEELERRGFKVSLAAWRGEDAADDAETVLLGTDRFDEQADRATGLTENGLDGMASALDQVFLGGETHVFGALSPAEVLEDMQAVGLHPDALAAYENSVGATESSITDELGYQGEFVESLASSEQEVATAEQIVL